MEKTYKELVKENEELEKELDSLEDSCAKKGMSWDDMLLETKDLRIKITQNDRKIRQIQNPTLQFGKKWNGELMTLEKFIASVNSGVFTDNDGLGRYATEVGVSDIYIYPSDILDNVYRKDFSHVLWLNK